MELIWNLIKDKKYPIKNKKVLLYMRTPNDIFDLSKGYLEFIAESRLIEKGRGKVWESLFYEYDEKNIIAWSYFEYPKL